MIGMLRGTVAELGGDGCILDVQGVGYQIHIPASLEGRLAEGAALTLYTHLAVREDALTLYGFASAPELALFRIARNVARAPFDRPRQP